MPPPLPINRYQFPDSHEAVHFERKIQCVMSTLSLIHTSDVSRPFVLCFKRRLPAFLLRAFVLTLMKVSPLYSTQANIYYT